MYHRWVGTFSHLATLWCSCGYVLLFFIPFTSAGESHALLPHAPMECAVSVILAIDYRVLSPRYRECMEHNRQWVLHPHILVALWCSCGCYVLLFSPSHLSGWVPCTLTICPNGVCSVSDPCYWLLCFVSSLLGMHGTWKLVSYASPHLLATLWRSCGCYVLLFSSSYLSGWVPCTLATCSNGVCSVSDPCYWLPCFVSSLLGMHGT